MRKAPEKDTHHLDRMTIEYVPVGDIKPNTYNPNRQDEREFELLQRSIEEDGFTQPIIILKDMTIVDGEHRWRAAEAMGFTEIPVVVVDMTAEQMRVATLRHNRARGTEDTDLTAELLRDLQQLGAMDWAKDSLMISDGEFNQMLDNLSAPDALAGQEFGEAWIPVKGKVEGHAVEADMIQIDQGILMGASTPAAVEKYEERTAALKAAKNNAERQAIQDQDPVLQRAFTFKGEEATLIRKVLGSTPAIRILELCSEVRGDGSGK